MPIDDRLSLEKEMAEMHTTFRSFYATIINTSTILVTANVTLLGFAISNKSSALVCIGFIFPLVLYGVIVFFGAMYVSVFFSGFKIEYTVDKNNPLFFSSLLTLMAPYLLKEFREILVNQVGDEQLEQLRSNSGYLYPRGTFILLGGASVSQVFAAEIGRAHV